jgi:hypothetical protein
MSTTIPEVGEVVSDGHDSGIARDEDVRWLRIRKGGAHDPGGPEPEW